MVETNNKSGSEVLFSEKDKITVKVVPKTDDGRKGKERRSLVPGSEKEADIDDGDDKLDSTYLPPSLIKRQTRQIWFNVICLFVSNSLVSCGRMSLVNATTSLITDHELAITALMLSSFVQYAGALILMTPIIKLLSLKNMSILGQIFSLLFIASFFLPNWTVLLSGAVALGIGFSLIMSCSYAYANVLGYWYHKVSGGNLSLILVLMSSLVNAGITGGFLWGNLLLFFILDSGSSEVNNRNETIICGISYCNENLRNFSTMASPPTWKYNTLIITFTSVAVVGVILSFFQTNVSSKQLYGKTTETGSFLVSFKEILMIAKEKRALLLACMSLFIGFEQSFVISDFTKVYVSCFLGVSRVGYIMIGFGISLVTMPSVHWLLVKVLGRATVIAISYLLFMGVFLMLILWSFEDDLAKIFFGLITIIGVADALMFCVITSMFALFYKNNVESALALSNFWRSSGLILSYTCNYFLCIRIKLFLLISLCTCALFAYLMLEYIIHRKYKKKKKQLQELELRMGNHSEIS